MCLSLLASSLLAPATPSNSTLSTPTAAASEAAQGSSLPGTHMRVRANETAYPALDYRYVEVNAYSIDAEGFDDDEFGYELQASYPLNDVVHVRGLLARSTLDIPLLLDSAEQTRTVWGLGFGLRHGLKERVDLFGEALLTGTQIDFELDGAGSVDSRSTGYVARAGLRWLYRPSWEIVVDGRSAGTEDVDSEYGFGAGVRIRITGGLTLGLTYSSLETSNTIYGGLRFGW